MFVVLHHSRDWSYYTSNVIGVYDTQELAQRAIDELLALQIENLKTTLLRDIQFYTKETNDQGT